EDLDGLCADGNLRNFQNAVLERRHRLFTNGNSGLLHVRKNLQPRQQGTQHELDGSARLPRDGSDLLQAALIAVARSLQDMLLSRRQHDRRLDRLSIDKELYAGNIRAQLCLNQYQRTTPRLDDLVGGERPKQEDWNCGDDDPMARRERRGLE